MVTGAYENISRSKEETDAIAEVLRIGHQFGFGNLMHALDSEWAKMLKEKWGVGNGKSHWLGS